jgi:polysaccharide biosynthesis/export protein
VIFAVDCAVFFHRWHRKELALRLGLLISGKIKSTFRRHRSLIGCVVVAASVAALSGCDIKSFIDPGEVGRFKKNALLVPILNKLDTGYEEPDEQFANAREVQPGDLIPQGGDYTIGKGDLVSVSVTDLVGPGVETTKTARVSDSGNINLPLVGQVHAEGLTETQLEKAISDAYKGAQLIQNAQVSVQVAEARNRTFSILGEQGSVQNPGEYAIVHPDFRLLDALILARDPGLKGIEYCYVVRKKNAGTGAAAPATQPAAAPTTAPGPDILAPRSRYDLIAPGHPVLLQTAGTADSTNGGALSLTPTTTPTPVAPSENSGRYIIVDGKPVLVNSPVPATQPLLTPTPVATPAPAPENPAAPAGPIAPAAPAVPAPIVGLTPTATPAPAPLPASQPFQFTEPVADDNQEVIKVPLAELRAGELKYNIVIRPADLILVPAPINGVYYMGGHVARVGVYQIAGQNVTLKQAIIAAGMMDQIAIPQRTDVVRRIGPDKEVFCRVNLDAIFDGRQPDFFIKPDDQITVGTNLFAPFLAAIRGGFRMSYGYGFIYDRNYAPAQKQPNQNINNTVTTGTTVG